MKKQTGVAFGGTAFILAVIFILLMGLCACEKEVCYDIIDQDVTWYVFEQDTIKTTICNKVDGKFCGNPDDLFSQTVTTFYKCGQTVDGTFYKPLTTIKRHMIILIK